MTGYDAKLQVAGSGPGLVLVPGMNGSGALFHHQVPRLARSHCVATYSLRDNPASMAELAGDLEAVVESVAPRGQRAIVVGESFGGAVALTFALAHPERVAALVIVNSFPFYRAQLRLRFSIAALRIIPWGTLTLVRRWTAFRMHSRHTSTAEVNDFIARTKDATRAGYVNRLQLLRGFDVRARLGEIEHPTLFLAADSDHLVPAVTEARFMSGRVRGSKMQVLEGHGHICLIAPDLDLAEIVTRWRQAARPASLVGSD